MTILLTQFSDYIASPDFQQKKYSLVSKYLSRFSWIKKPGEARDHRYQYCVLTPELFKQYEDKLLSLAEAKYRESNTKSDLSDF